MVNMDETMDERTEKALSQISKEIIDVLVVFKDDGCETGACIAVGLSEDECNDEDVFYYAEDVNEVRSLLKGAKNWETNGSEFYIKSFSNGKVSWEAE